MEQIFCESVEWVKKECLLLKLRHPNFDKRC